MRIADKPPGAAACCAASRMRWLTACNLAWSKGFREAIKRETIECSTTFTAATG